MLDASSYTPPKRKKKLIDLIRFVCFAAFCSHPFNAVIFPCTQSEKIRMKHTPSLESCSLPCCTLLSEIMLPWDVTSFLPPGTLQSLPACKLLAFIHRRASPAAPTLCTRCLCTGEGELTLLSAAYIPRVSKHLPFHSLPGLALPPRGYKVTESCHALPQCRVTLAADSLCFGTAGLPEAASQV